MGDDSAQGLVQRVGDVSSNEASDALVRFVASAAFRTALQLVAFLTYIVRTTLQGCQHEIKGYTIAVEALGRPDDFDPVADPIVRVEVGRLRRAIDGYYAADGVCDPVRIIGPRGSYIPQSQRSEPAGIEAGSDAESASDSQRDPAPALAASDAGQVARRRPLWLGRPWRWSLLPASAWPRSGT
ncbi:MAG: hypothetical protein NTZ14_16950 [Hyphomicrobiales bacterium]|nr:hypothetical protein [Hyphomicrobiales bacterium]